MPSESQHSKLMESPKRYLYRTQSFNHGVEKIDLSSPTMQSFSQTEMNTSISDFFPERIHFLTENQWDLFEMVEFCN